MFECYWCYLPCFRYLKEDKPHGSAGGLYYFRDMIMEENPVRFLFIFSSLTLFWAILLEQSWLLNSHSFFFLSSHISFCWTVMFAAVFRSLTCLVNFLLHIVVYGYNCDWVLKASFVYFLQRPIKDMVGWERC